MAKLEDVDIEHRGLAQRHIPAKTLARLSRAELRYRVKHAKHLTDRANTLSVPESALALHEHARKILASEPAAEYVVDHKRRNELLQSAPSHLHHEYRDMVYDHRDSHEYPPGLTGAVDAMLLGKPVADPELAEAALASINRAGVRP